MNEDFKTDLNPRWLNLNQAKDYCPIGKKRLICLIKAREIRGGRQRDNEKHPWFIDRLSLDKYMESMIDPNEAEQKGIEIMKRIM